MLRLPTGSEMPHHQSLCRSRKWSRAYSGRLAEVLVKHAAQTMPAQYRSGLRGCCRCLLPERALSQALVGPGFLVVLDELPQHVLEVAATKDQQVVEELPPGCPHPSLGEGVGVSFQLQLIGTIGGDFESSIRPSAGWSRVRAARLHPCLGPATACALSRRWERADTFAAGCLDCRSRGRPPSSSWPRAVRSSGCRGAEVCASPRGMVRMRDPARMIELLGPLLTTLASVLRSHQRLLFENLLLCASSFRSPSAPSVRPTGPRTCEEE
jgi:hypothetical protein